MKKSNHLCGALAPIARVATALAVILAFIVIDVTAATVSEQQAATIAARFVQGNSSRHAHAPIGAMKLAKAAKSVTGDADYYVFNLGTDEGFVIVAGDDRVMPVWGYTDSGTYSDADVPQAMQWWLEGYQRQLQYLRLHPQAARSVKALSTSVEPLMKTTWRQSSPFNLQCPKIGYSSTPYPPAGCVAIAMAQVMKYHEWPVTGTGSHSYTSSKGGVQSRDFSQSTYDWENMLDTYATDVDRISDAAKNAVAQLAGDCGVAVDMQYGMEGSGAQIYDAMNALSTYFGYNRSMELLMRDFYDTAEWDNMLKEEIDNNRPVIYGGSNENMYGHCFVFDGYNANGYFHINWGWNGDYNGYFATSLLDSGRSNANFSYWQQAIFGTTPDRDGSSTAKQHPLTGYLVNFTANQNKVEVGSEVGLNVEGITLVGDGSYTGYCCGLQILSADEQTVVDTQDLADLSECVIGQTYALDEKAVLAVPADITEGVYHVYCVYGFNKDLTNPIRYQRPTAATPFITMVVSNGVAYFFEEEITGPTIIAGTESLSFDTDINAPVETTFNVSGYLLESDITITVNDGGNDIISVTPATLSPNSDKGVNTTVTVKFTPREAGTFSASLTLTATGATAVTVPITAKATQMAGGTAKDAYLNIARYNTIDAAGWTSSSSLSQLYKYTEYESDNAAWLTLSIFGACQFTNNQKWITTSSSSIYEYENWNATDVFAGGAYYKGSWNPGIWGKNTKGNTDEYNVTFYVTNCDAVKLLGKNSSNSTDQYPASMRVYECTENANATLNESTTVVAEQKNGTASKQFELSIDNLDPNKIYKVMACIYRSYLYEIAFRTPLSTEEEPEAMTLAELLTKGNVGNEYAVTDLQAVQLVDKGNEKFLLCKDGNASIERNEMDPVYTDYMAQSFFKRAAEGYDQSNWIILRADSKTTDALVKGLLDHKLTGVVGTLNDNREMTLSTAPTAGEAVTTYEPNIFITASFGGMVQQEKYFFVQPKLNEYVNIMWAQWDGSKFIVPTNSENKPYGNFDGAFALDRSLMASPMELKTGEGYVLKGIVVKNTAATTHTKRAAATGAMVRALSIQSVDDSVITAVDDVKTTAPVVSVTYYNAMGAASATPFHGINVVVTRYANGTTTATKVVK